MSDKTGGPAFPALPIQRHTDTGEILYQNEGISVRDYFAAKAMQALLPTNYIDANAILAYRVADAMLRAREQ